MQSEKDHDLSAFFKEVSTLVTINQEEEQRLGKLIQDNMVVNTLKGRKKERVLSSEEAKKAHEKLILANMKLLIGIASDIFEHTEIPLAILVNEGYFGLNSAALKFDPSRKCKFSTYATPWIKTRILLYLQTEADLIHIPSHAKTVYNHYCKIFNTTALPSIKSFEDKAMGLLGNNSFYESQEIYRITQDLLSLQQSMSEDSELHFEDLIIESIDESMEHSIDVKNDIRDVLDILEKEEQFIVKSLYGLDCEELTVVELAAKLGKKIKETKAIVANIYEKLKGELIERGYDDCVD